MPRRPFIQGRFAALPCVPRQTGRRVQLGAWTGSSIPSRLASNRTRSFNPVWLWYSARATGFGVVIRKVANEPSGWIPVGAAEHRSRFGGKRVALFELDLQVAGAANPASSVSAQTGEKRREPASAGKPSGPPFFWVLFFGGAKKSILPEGAKPDAGCSRDNKAAISTGKHPNPSPLCSRPPVWHHSPIIPTPDPYTRPI